MNFIVIILVCNFCEIAQTASRDAENQLDLWDLAIQSRKLQLQGVRPIVVLQNGKLVRMYLNRNSNFETKNTNPPEATILTYENHTEKKQISNRRGKSMKFNEPNDDIDVVNRMLIGVATTQKSTRSSLGSSDNLTETQKFQNIPSDIQEPTTMQNPFESTERKDITILYTTSNPNTEITTTTTIQKLTTIVAEYDTELPHVHSLSETVRQIKWDYSDQLAMSSVGSRTVTPTTVTDINTTTQVERESTEMSTTTPKNTEQKFTSEIVINSVSSVTESISTVSPSVSGKTVSEMINSMRATTVQIEFEKSNDSDNSMDYLADAPDTIVFSATTEFSVPVSASVGEGLSTESANVPSTTIPTDVPGELITLLRATTMPIKSRKPKNVADAWEYFYDDGDSAPVSNIPSTTTPSSTIDKIMDSIKATTEIVESNGDSSVKYLADAPNASDLNLTTFATINEIIDSMRDANSIDYISDVAAVSASTRNVVPFKFLIYLPQIGLLLKVLYVFRCRY